MSLLREDQRNEWAQQWPNDEPLPPPELPPGSDRSTWGLAFLTLLAIVLAGTAYIVLMSDESGADAEPATQLAGTVELASTTAPTPTTTAPAVVTPATERSTTSATSAPTSSTEPVEAETTTPTESTDTEPVRSAVYSQGKVYLSGTVPSQEIADVIAARVAAVIGPENVVVEYVINPDAPLPDSAPLYVDDKILFGVGSSTINPEFEPLLQLGAILFQQNDSVTITVIAHTDSIGDADFNQTLSDDRAQAVKNYWIAAGIAPERIEPIGRGESSPDAENETDVGRAANRRAEFVVHGILG